ncbi:MAG: hypothetical protein WDN44_10595 [Sphingomonas sp.]
MPAVLGEEGFDPRHCPCAQLAPVSQVAHQPRIVDRKPPEPVSGMLVRRRNRSTLRSTAMAPSSRVAVDVHQMFSKIQLV